MCEIPMGATQYSCGFTKPDTKPHFFTEDYLASLVLAVSPDLSEYDEASQQAALNRACIRDNRNPFLYRHWYE